MKKTLSQLVQTRICSSCGRPVYERLSTAPVARLIEIVGKIYGVAKTDLCSAPLKSSSYDQQRGVFSQKCSGGNSRCSLALTNLSVEPLDRLGIRAESNKTGNRSPPAGLIYCA
jgi:hypothetical protein